MLPNCPEAEKVPLPIDGVTVLSGSWPVSTFRFGAVCVGVVVELGGTEYSEHQFGSETGVEVGFLAGRISESKGGEAQFAEEGERRGIQVEEVVAQEGLHREEAIRFLLVPWVGGYVQVIHPRHPPTNDWPESIRCGRTAPAPLLRCRSVLAGSRYWRIRTHH